MNLKEKMQEHKDIKQVTKNPKALNSVKKQTKKVIFAAFRKFGTLVIPAIHNLTVELYEELEKYSERNYGKEVFPCIPEEKLTEELCLAAIKNSILFFDDIPQKHKTYKVWLEYIKRFGTRINKVPKQFRTAELCLAAVQNDAGALFYVPEELHTNELYEAALETNGNERYRSQRINLLQYMPKQTAEICLRAVKQNGMALKDAKFKCEEICLAAVKENGLALQFVENQTKEICFEAVDENRKALMYIKDNDIAQLAALYANSRAE